MKDINWQKISENLVYNGRRKIKEISYRLPSGKIEKFEIIILSSSVCIFPLTIENKIILTKQFRPGPNTTLLELPGGKVGEDEDVNNAAEREFSEETGYKGKLIMLGKSFDSAYNTRIRYHFLATDCKKITEPLNDDTEPILVVLVPIAKFVEQLHKGNLTDSETAYRALEHLKILGS